jgi:hypothetical protein
MNGDYQTAIHEAGHAVASRRLHRWGGAAGILGADCAAIVNTGRSEVLLEGVSGYSVTWNDRDFNSVIVSLAGAAAVEEFGYQPTGCEDDYNKADVVLAEMGWNDLERRMLRHALMNQARALIARHRAKVRKVAKALKRRGQLSGDEIDAILAGAS